MMRGVIVAAFALVLALAATSADARASRAYAALCSLSGGLPPFSIARTQDIVAASQVSVRATVLGEIPPPPSDPRSNDRLVVFAVDEVLRGSDVPDTLRFYGVIEDRDARQGWEEDEIPHKSYIRRHGGSCQAVTYRASGQYLLLLRRLDEGAALSPYWAVLAPTNNEIRGADDRWVQWVRAEIARNPSQQAPARVPREAR